MKTCPGGFRQGDDAQFQGLLQAKSFCRDIMLIVSERWDKDDARHKR